MKKTVFMFLSSFLAVAMVAIIPSELVAAKWVSPEAPAETAPAQQGEKDEVIGSILSELNRAKGMTTDEGVIGKLNGIIDSVRKLGWLEFTNQEQYALRLKYSIAETLEGLINELPLVTAGATTALAAMPESNPLYEELVRVRAKIERLIALETPLEAVPPEPPTISRVPETERLIVYSAKFLCGPAFGREGVQRGSYSTAVNVHNPHNARVTLYKKAVIAEREDDPRGRISEFRRVVLGPDEAIEIDCLDIYGLLGPDEEETELTSPGQQSQTLTAATPGTGEESDTTLIRTSDIEPVSSLVRFIKGFVVIYASAPLDVVAVYTASTTVGFSMDVEYLSPSTASTLPYTPPSEGAECPQGCKCLTKEEAVEEGLTAWCNGEIRICEYDENQRPLRYCFGEPTEQVQCPQGCQCLALSPAAAEEQGLEQCLDVSCGTDAAGNVMYCYRESQDECPGICECLSDREARALGYTLCGGKRIPCGYAPGAAERWCYEPATPTRISITPSQASNLVGTEHEVVVTVYDEYGSPIPSIAVTITVNGVNSQAAVELTTNTNGQVSFDYVGTNTGSDTIVAVVDGLQATAFKSWYRRGQ
jgi:hypothetical protein